MPSVLIIDDDTLFCDMLARTIKRLGHETHCAHTLAEGLAQATAETFDVIYLDVNLPDGNGLEELERFQSTPSNPEVIIITGASDADGAEMAITSGAWDYIAKLSSREATTLPLARALQYREEKRSAKKLVVLDREGIIGESPGVRRCLDVVAQAAGSETSVLVTGETGTGKELFARAIHTNSPRTKENFVVVDCAALPDSLIESMLFGHRKGAFTGADKDRAGLIAQADQGTLFLDEVGELPLGLQKAFLRVLQERRFRPLGAQQEINSDFRLIAATNCNLEELVQQGGFRQDLLFRLRSFVIDLPPLRERKEDISALTAGRISTLCERQGITRKGFSPDFFEALTLWDWPGNVRELLQAVDRAFAAARDEGVLFPKHLPTQLRVQLARANHATPGPSEASAVAAPTRTLREIREETVREAERRYLEDLMASVGGDVKEVCRIAGLANSQFYALLKKHGIPRKQ